jgi:hypothetical protein
MPDYTDTLPAPPQPEPGAPPEKAPQDDPMRGPFREPWQDPGSPTRKINLPDEQPSIIIPPPENPMIS